jgi:hypothetical protein
MQLPTYQCTGETQARVTICVYVGMNVQVILQVRHMQDCQWCKYRYIISMSCGSSASVILFASSLPT